MNEDSYYDKMISGKTRSGRTYVQKVVSQPTQQSNIKTVVDRSTASGIREVKSDRGRSE